MRILTLSIAGLLSYQQLAAQCTFDPTITPDPVILCPNESLLLSTQAYDSWQWFKDGQPIPGAVQHSYQVNAATDVGSTFTVEATFEGCTEMSPPVLVDGWVFLLPFVMSEGDDPHGFGPNGEALYCVGDTLLLTLMMPYDTAIQWTNGGQPIPGANNTQLVVTTSGDYSVSGAPSLCPNFIQQLGVTITALFEPVIQSTIVENSGQLCAVPAGNSHQWFLNGQALPGATGSCVALSGPGIYEVNVDHGTACQLAAEPYLATTIGGPDAADAITMRPVPASLAVRIEWPGTLPGEWSVVDAKGRAIAWGSVPTDRALDLDVSGWPQGAYTITTVDARSVRSERFQVQR